MLVRLGRRDVQPAGEIRPANLADEVRVATHHELIAGTGQANVKVFAGALERRLRVDDEHDCAAFEPFEAEDMAVEDLVGSLEAVPVGGVAGGLPFLLFGVAGAGGRGRRAPPAPAARPLLHRHPRLLKFRPRPACQGLLGVKRLLGSDSTAMRNRPGNTRALISSGGRSSLMSAKMSTRTRAT